MVHGSQATVDHVGWPYRPQGLTSAQMNLPFCVATLLAEGDVFVDQFSDAVVADPRRMALAAKVEVVHDPAITARGAKLRHMVRVEVHFTTARARPRPSRRRAAASRNSRASDDVVDKFRKLTRRMRSDADVERIAELVLGCEKLPDVGVLATALGAAPAR